MFKTILFFVIGIFSSQILCAQLILPTTAPTLWLIADSVKQENYTSVSLWRDLSGNSNNAYQTKLAKTPKLNKTSLNGHAVVAFDGDDDILQTDVIALTKGYEIDIFMVYKSIGERDIICELSKDLNTVKSGFFIIDHYEKGLSGLCAALKGNAKGGCEGNGGRNYVTNRITSDTSFDYKLINCYLAKNRDEAAQVILLKNGERLLSNGKSYYCTHTDKFNKDNFFIGGRGNTNANCINGEIAEIIIFPSILTTNDRQKVEDYLKAKYFPNME